MKRLLLAVVLLLIAGCSNEIDTAAQQAADTGKVVQPGEHLTFAMVTHGAANDPFWSIVKSGERQAADDLDVTVTYRSSDDPQQQAQDIDAAVNQKVDGLAVSMANPDALRASIRRAVSAGIPVITLNSGQDQSKSVGALTHVGQDEYVAGQAAGKKLKELGLHDVICVIHEAGNVGLEQRCAGAKAGFGGKIQNLQVNVNDVQSAGSTIKSKLQANQQIDGVLSLNPAIASAAAQARDEAKSRAKVATFDLSAEVARQVQQGKIVFAVDQQPYLQGYLPIQQLYLYQVNRDVVGGGKPVLTGPTLVTKQNAGTVADLAKRGTR